MSLLFLLTISSIVAATELTSLVDDDNNADNEIPVLIVRDFNQFQDVSTTTAPTIASTRAPIQLPVVNRTLQVGLLAVILTAAVVANGSVIANISRDSLKLRMVHFLLIRHVCIADCLGALLVLPVPLVAVAKGEWDYGEDMCTAVSTTTAACWTMHLLAVALYRADRVLAVWLPTGKYPVFSVRTTNILLVLIWVLTFSGSYGATKTFGHTFQPALALCIPNVPLVFFIIVFAGYCTGLVALTTGYVLAFARRRRKKRKRDLEEKVQFERNFQKNLFQDGPTSTRTNSLPLQSNPQKIKSHRRINSEQMAPHSLSTSSFSNSTSNYDRLTEDSDSFNRKLTKSVSFDETQSGGGNIRRGFIFTNSKSLEFNSMTVYEARSDNVFPFRGEEEMIAAAIADSSNNNEQNVVKLKKRRTRVKHFKPRGSKANPAKRAMASYAVSVGHLLLYLPAMLVVGLKGASLPPGAAFFCGLVVYCEFLVQPIALLLVSPLLRGEVFNTVFK